MVVGCRQVEAYLEGVERAKAQALLLLQGRAYPAVRERLEKLLAQHDATATGSSKAATGEGQQPGHLMLVGVMASCGRAGGMWPTETERSVIVLAAVVCREGRVEQPAEAAPEPPAAARLPAHARQLLVGPCVSLSQAAWVHGGLTVLSAMAGCAACSNNLQDFSAAASYLRRILAVQQVQIIAPCMPPSLPPCVFSDWPDDAVVVVHACVASDGVSLQLPGAGRLSCGPWRGPAQPPAAPEPAPQDAGRPQGRDTVVLPGTPHRRLPLLLLLPLTRHVAAV